MYIIAGQAPNGCGLIIKHRVLSLLLAFCLYGEHLGVPQALMFGCHQAVGWHSDPVTLPSLPAPPKFGLPWLCTLPGTELFLKSCAPRQKLVLTWWDLIPTARSGRHVTKPF